MPMTDPMTTQSRLRRGSGLARLFRRCGGSLCLVAFLAAHAASPGGAKAARIEYTGMCDASAAVAADDLHFLVASDEDSVLRLYRVDPPGRPVATFDLTSWLELDPKNPETDIEGAARVGDRVYWITSHGRNARGKVRESRGRFFATQLRQDGGSVSVTIEGQPYRGLLADLLADPRLAPFQLAAAAKRAPKEVGALNIEGLCEGPDGSLLIGFRNPQPQRRALVVPLLNPAEAIAGRRAKLGDPLLLDLGGLGVRDLARVEGEYLVLAGPHDGRDDGRLFRWSGRGAEPVPLSASALAKLNPEVIVTWPGARSERLLILSDDGARKIGGCPCKDLKEPERQRFRGAWFSLP